MPNLFRSGASLSVPRRGVISLHIRPKVGIAYLLALRQ